MISSIAGKGTDARCVRSIRPYRLQNPVIKKFGSRKRLLKRAKYSPNLSSGAEQRASSHRGFHHARRRHGSRACVADQMNKRSPLPGQAVACRASRPPRPVCNFTQRLASTTGACVARPFRVGFRRHVPAAARTEAMVGVDIHTSHGAGRDPTAP